MMSSSFAVREKSLNVLSLKAGLVLGLLIVVVFLFTSRIDQKKKNSDYIDGLIPPGDMIHDYEIHNHLLDTHEFFDSHAVISNHDDDERNDYYYLYYNTTPNGTRTAAPPTAITPLFWHIPKAAGKTIIDLFDGCLKFVIASQIGRPYSNETELRVVAKPSGIQVVNIDTTSLQGIEHAKRLGFNIDSPIYDVEKLLPNNNATTAAVTAMANNNNSSDHDDDVHADVIIALRLRPVIVELFDNDHKGLLFTVLRHPIHRAASLFHDSRFASSGMSMLEYFEKRRENKKHNWMTRMLSRDWDNAHTPVNRTHLEQAKYILRRKTVVGIYEQLDLSLRRFAHFFQWDKAYHNTTHHNSSLFETCLEQYVGGGGGGGGGGGDVSSNNDMHHQQQHPQIISEGTPEWEAAKKGLEYDIELYEYAVELFQEQSVDFQFTR